MQSRARNFRPIEQAPHLSTGHTIRERCHKLNCMSYPARVSVNKILAQTIGLQKNRLNYSMMPKDVFRAQSLSSSQFSRLSGDNNLYNRKISLSMKSRQQSASNCVKTHNQQQKSQNPFSSNKRSLKSYNPRAVKGENNDRGFSNIPYSSTVQANGKNWDSRVPRCEIIQNYVEFCSPRQTNQISNISCPLYGVKQDQNTESQSRLNTREYTQQSNIRSSSTIGKCQSCYGPGNAMISSLSHSMGYKENVPAAKRPQNLVSGATKAFSPQEIQSKKSSSSEIEVKENGNRFAFLKGPTPQQVKEILKISLFSALKPEPVQHQLRNDELLMTKSQIKKSCETRDKTVRMPTENETGSGYDQSARSSIEFAGFDFDRFQGLQDMNPRRASSINDNEESLNFSQVIARASNQNKNGSGFFVNAQQKGVEKRGKLMSLLSNFPIRQTERDISSSMTFTENQSMLTQIQ